ncbi:hypothetical protein HRI_000784500 [Hibiscus trionum]|uniref:Transposase n=1 Tax=Hibiscus trionum TaxID=183268 RepID=A0A9W7H519_HIBTR|nr:hypothetical protein HRI_000784500 [Hibiscus trionum]
MPRRKLSDLRIVQVPREEEVSNNEGVSGVGSSQVPETVEETQETQVEVGQRRKSRGRTMLTGLYNLPPGERVQVSRNDAGQPIGAEAGVLANVIGMTACNGSLLPISYESWREMPNGNKNQAVDHIKERFSLEVSDDYVKHALGKKWRDHKSFLKKKYFKNSLSLQEKMQNVPPGLLRYQWEDAVRFWSSTKGEERERVGELKSGSSVGRVQLFDITHTKKDGSAITPEAAEIMAKMKDKKIEFEATASTNGSANLDDIDNQVIADVLGPERYGRVRCQGSFVTPTKYFGAQSSQYMPSQSRSSQAEVNRLQQQLTQFKAEVEAREAERAAREAEREASYKSLENKFQELMAMFKQNPPQNPPS